MKTLEEKFELKGWRHVQEWRRGNLAIYRRFAILNFRKIEHYEVVVIREQPAAEAFGIKFEEKEVYPTANSWGKLGWTCHSLDRAHDKVLEVRDSLKKL